MNGTDDDDDDDDWLNYQKKKKTFSLVNITSLLNGIIIQNHSVYYLFVFGWI